MSRSAPENEKPVLIGEELKTLRLERGLDVAEVAGNLNVRTEYIIAIEVSDYDSLPGEAYAIGYVRSYARFLGFHPDDCIRRYKAELEGIQNLSGGVIPRFLEEHKVPFGGAFIAVTVLVLAGLGVRLATIESGIENNDGVVVLTEPEPTVENIEMKVNDIVYLDGDAPTDGAANTEGRLSLKATKQS